MGKEFTSEYQPKKHTGPRMATVLNKLLSAEWKIKNKQLKELVKTLKLKETFEVAIVLRRLLNACKGDDTAIERIFDRVDGRVAQKLLGAGLSGDTKVIVIYPPDYKRKEQIADKAKEVSSRISGLTS